MKNIRIFKVGQAKSLIVGVISALALGAAYLLYRRQEKRQIKQFRKPINAGPLNMERYIFNLHNHKIQAVVEQGGDCYAVHLNGKFTGNMWREEGQGMEWRTDSAELKAYVAEISENLSEVFSRKGFPSLLKGTYPEIVSTDWKTTETLEVLIKPETDLEVFSTFLKDEVLNLVTFDEHLDLMVKKENEDYFVLIGVN